MLSPETPRMTKKDLGYSFYIEPFRRVVTNAFDEVKFNYPTDWNSYKKQNLLSIDDTVYTPLSSYPRMDNK